MTSESLDVGSPYCTSGISAANTGEVQRYRPMN